MISADSLILTTEGLKRPSMIQPGMSMLCYGYAREVLAVKTKTEKVRRIRTKNGFNIAVSEDQTMLTKDGWVQARELSIKSKLMLSNRHDSTWGVDLEYDSFVTGRSYGVLDVQMRDAFGMKGSAFIKGYIAGIFSAHGNVYDLKYGTSRNPHLRYTNSFNDLEYIQVCLAAFGVHSTILVSGKTRSLNITGQGIYNFSDRIAINGPIREKLDNILNELTPNARIQPDYSPIEQFEDYVKVQGYSFKVKEIKGVSVNGLIVGA